MANKAWIQLEETPLGNQCAKTSVLLNDNKILLSPQYDNYLHLFHTKTEQWTKHYWKNENFNDHDLETHAVCLSIDKTKLFLYEGFDRVLIVIDLETMKASQIIDGLLGCGPYPLIMPDPQNTKIIHIIGGDFIAKHVAVNINNEQMNEIHEFSSEPDEIEGAGIVYIKHKNAWIYFGGTISNGGYIYDCNTKKWTDINIERIKNIQNFGYILTEDEKYIVIFCGYKYSDSIPIEALDDIVILNIDTMECVVSKMKCPVTDYDIANAVVTNAGYIHLFTSSDHWKIHVNQLIIPSDTLIFGYVNQCVSDIPNDITNIIVRFYGSLIDQC